MALSAETKMKIVIFLGWPAKTLIAGSTHYSKYISDKLDQLSPEAETIINSYITRIDAIDTKLSTSFSKDNIRRVDDIEFFGDNNSKMRSERKKLLCELADILDIQMRKSCGMMSGVVA